MTQRRKSQSIGLLMIVVSSAVVLWALAAMVQTTPVAHADDPPPQIETITVVSSKGTYFYRPVLGEEGGEVYFNSVGDEGAGQVLTVTVTVTSSTPITLTGAPAFGYNPPPDNDEPWEITYTVEMSAGTQNGIVFTATNTSGTDTAVITFTEDNFDPGLPILPRARPDSYTDTGEYDDDTEIYFTWDAASDNPDGSGIATYYAEIDDSTPDEGIVTDFEDTDTGSEGLNAYYVAAVDHVGNEGSAVSDTITIDLIPPSITGITVTSDSPTYFYGLGLGVTEGEVFFNSLAGMGGEQTITVTVSFTDDNPASLEGDDAFNDNPPADTSGPPWTVSYSIEENAPSETNRVFTVTDKAGLTDTAVITFTQDNTEPFIPSALIEDYGSPWLHVDNFTVYYGDEMPEPQTFRVQGESNDGSGVGLDHAEFSPAFGRPPPLDDPEPSAWAGRYDPDDWDWGNGTIIVTIYDLVGNAAYQIFNYIRDPDPPIVDVYCPASTSEPSFPVSWSASDPGSDWDHFDVQYREETGDWQDWHTDTTLTEDTFGPTYPVLVQDDHTYYFRVRAEDKVNNESPYTNGEDATTYHSGIKKVFLPIIIAPDPNWGFETGDFTNWQHGGQLPQSVSTAEHYSGSYSALLGSSGYACSVVPVGSAWLRRSVTVPSSGSPTLSFYYRIFTQDKTDPDHYDQYDLFAVEINGSRLWQDANESDPWGCSTLKDLGWQPAIVSLEDYKGQTIQISFYVYNRPDSWYNTYVYIDDVSVQ